MVTSLQISICLLVNNIRFFNFYVNPQSVDGRRRITQYQVHPEIMRFEPRCPPNNDKLFLNPFAQQQKRRGCCRGFGLRADKGAFRSPPGLLRRLSLLEQTCSDTMISQRSRTRSTVTKLGRPRHSGGHGSHCSAGEDLPLRAPAGRLWVRLLQCALKIGGAERGQRGWLPSIHRLDTVSGAPKRDERPLLSHAEKEEATVRRRL